MTALQATEQRRRLDVAHIPVGTMAGVIIMSHVSLADEKAVILCLLAAGFQYGDIIAGMDQAMEVAKEAMEEAL